MLVCVDAFDDFYEKVHTLAKPAFKDMLSALGWVPEYVVYANMQDSNTYWIITSNSKIETDPWRNGEIDNWLSQQTLVGRYNRSRSHQIEFELADDAILFKMYFSYYL